MLDATKVVTIDSYKMGAHPTTERKAKASAAQIDDILLQTTTKRLCNRVADSCPNCIVSTESTRRTVLCYFFRKWQFAKLVLPSGRNQTGTRLRIGSKNNKIFFGGQRNKQNTKMRRRAHKQHGAATSKPFLLISEPHGKTKQSTCQ